MYPVSLVSVRTRALQRCALENSDVVKIPEANSYVNESGADLHDLLAGAYGEKYAMKRQTFASQANKELYDFATDILATDFMQLQGLDLWAGGRWLKLGEFKFAEREKYQYPGAGGVYVYRLEGQNLVIAPTPQSVVQFKLYYTPTWTMLVEDTDTFDSVDGWEEYVIVDVAIKMLVKQDLPCDEFKEAKRGMRERIDRMKLMRNTEKAPRIIDLDDEDYLFTTRRFPA